MRMHTRVGLGAGCIGFVLLYTTEWAVALGGAVLLALVAVLAGLGMAKWLPRDWYGRQLEAGARAGGIACGLAAAGLFLSLAFSGPHAIPALAARSQLLGISFGPAVRWLGAAGWFLTGLVISLVAAAIGTGLSAGIALAGAWDKNLHTIEVIQRAREAAQRSTSMPGTARTTTGMARARATGGPGMAPPAGMMLGQTSGPQPQRPLREPARQHPVAQQSQQSPQPPVQRPLQQRPQPAAPVPIVPPNLPPDTGKLRAALSAWASGNRAKPAPQRKTEQDAGQPESTPQPNSDRDNWLC